MAGPQGGRDQPSSDPTGHFVGSAPSQFGSSYYPIDTELTTNYNHPTFARQMEEAANAVDNMDQGNMNSMALDTNGAQAATAVDPAMAPPQTSNQPGFVAAGSRPSVDASSETPHDPQTGDKRKRSKASRACDECRRKKVRHNSGRSPNFSALILTYNPRSNATLPPKSMVLQRLVRTVRKLVSTVNLSASL